jgi:hypothetical protein
MDLEKQTSPRIKHGFNGSTTALSAEIQTKICLSVQISAIRSISGKVSVSA